MQPKVEMETPAMINLFASSGEVVVLSRHVVATSDVMSYRMYRMYRMYRVVFTAKKGRDCIESGDQPIMHSQNASSRAYNG